MSDRYVTRAAVLQWDDDAAATASEMIVEDDAPRPTGLLNAQGEPLYRVRERLPVGFHGRVKGC
jgi:hypothetical protein